MPRSRGMATLACVELDAHELDLVDRMMSAVGLTSHANVLRCALRCFAQHLDMPPPVHVFAVRKTRGLPAGRFNSKRTPI